MTAPAARTSVVVLPDRPWAVAAPRWRAADELGASTVWTYDHLAWGQLGGSPWYGAVPTLAAAAGITSRAGLGTLVTSPSFRHPVPFASDVLTLDDLCGGRLVLGIGAGGTGADALALGLPLRTRGERAGRLEEFVGLLDQLLSEPSVSWAGAHFAAEAVFRAPRRQHPRVPFVVAASGPRAMRVAARHGAAWVTYGDRTTLQEPMGSAEAYEVIAVQCAQLDEACAAVGRDPASLRRVLLTGLTADRPLASVGAYDDLAGRYGQLGFDEIVVHWPEEDPAHPFAGSGEVLAEVLGRG